MKDRADSQHSSHHQIQQRLTANSTKTNAQLQADIDAQLYKQDQGLDELGKTIRQLRQIAEAIDTHVTNEKPHLDKLDRKVEDSTERTQRATKTAEELAVNVSESSSCSIL